MTGCQLYRKVDWGTATAVRAATRTAKQQQQRQQNQQQTTTALLISFNYV